MSDDERAGDTRDSRAVASELADVEVELESLRDTSIPKRIAHLFLVAMLAVLGTAVSAAALTAVLGALLTTGPLALVTLVSTIAFLVFYARFFDRHLFVPRRGAVEAHQDLYRERQGLREELERTVEREEDAERALANAQRAHHGGNLSIAAPSADGGLEVAVATEGSLSAAREEVVLDLGEEADQDAVATATVEVSPSRDPR
jgi:hypothetical protein